MNKQQSMAQAAARCLELKVSALLIRVKTARGSVPREAGTVMLVTRTDAFGTIGGGHLEWDALRKARALLEQGQSVHESAQEHQYALGPSLGQCCGGAVGLEFIPLTEASLELVQEADSPLFRVFVFGAGHVGQALIAVLAPVRCAIIWIDERENSFPEQLPSHVQAYTVDCPEEEVALSKPGDMFVVMTHRHDLDCRIVEKILRKADASYIGLIGSATKRARFASQLAERGLSMATVQCPIGTSAFVDHLSPGVRKEPGVLAIAIANELFQHCRA